MKEGDREKTTRDRSQVVDLAGFYPDIWLLVFID